MPYRSLTDHERDIVLRGEPVRQQVTLHSGRNARTVQLSVNYDNAVAAVERSLRSDNERTRLLVQRFLVTRVCSVCHGARLRPEALASQLGGRNIAEISALTLDELRGFAAGLPAGLPTELSRMTTGLLAELDGRLTPLLDVGLSYLTLDRAGASLSTGERQRIELTSTVRASTTGMLYVLDEPSVGLHPSNVAGLLKTITALAANGNSVVVVEHERECRQMTTIHRPALRIPLKGDTQTRDRGMGALATRPVVPRELGPFRAGLDRPGNGAVGLRALRGVLAPGDTPVTADVPAAPAVRGGVVSRRALFGRLVEAERVVQISAPAGSGKTVLVRSWIAEAGLAGAGRVGIGGPRGA